MNDWKYVLAIWLPIFAGTVWYGISNNYEDMLLYGIAMGLASWAIAGRAVFIYRKWQEHCVQRCKDDVQDS